MMSHKAIVDQLTSCAKRGKEVRLVFPIGRVQRDLLGQRQNGWHGLWWPQVAHPRAWQQCVYHLPFQPPHFRVEQQVIASVLCPLAFFLPGFSFQEGLLVEACPARQKSVRYGPTLEAGTEELRCR